VEGKFDLARIVDTHSGEVPAEVLQCKDIGSL
jgi:hypothetical protein